MRVQRAPQAQEVLGHSDLVMITERVDDVALRIGPMVHRGFVEGLDSPSPRPWTQRGISGGWTAVRGLASLLTAGDHRTVSVEASSTGMQTTLRRLSAPVIAPLDGRDDRRGHLRQPVRKATAWHQIERDVHARSMAVPALPQDVLRGDATTVSGDHEGTAGGLVQCGQRNDDPTRPQITGMMGSLDPVGRPLATEGVSGERADEGVSLPLIERLQSGLHKTGRRWVGDGKRRGLDTRPYLARPQDWYVSPWPVTGATAEAMDAWIPAGVAQGAAGA